jgi:drug/metabolite transporter (DMT)-like permease
LKNLKLPVPFFALSAMLFWGLSFIWSSLLLKVYDPITIIFFRLILSAAFLYFLVRVMNVSLHIDREDRWLLFFSSIFNPFLYFLGENYGLKSTTSTTTAVIIATIPVFSPIAAYLFLREKLTLFNLFGILVSFGGVLLMLVNGQFTLAVKAEGILCLLGAVLSALFYSVLLRRLTPKYSPLSMVFYQNMAGVFLFLPLFLVFDLRTFPSIVPGSHMIVSYICLSILASSLSYVFYARTIKEIGISRANVYTNLIPVITAIFSYIILSESFSLQKIVGIIIVIGGILITEKKKRVTTS